jgi:glutamate 5-kinase
MKASPGDRGSVGSAAVRQDILQNPVRVVVKLGTAVLTDSAKKPDRGQFENLVGQVAALHAEGREVVVVTSGAVGAGMGALGFNNRPTELADLQACAAVGQSRLMAAYQELFERHGLAVAQVLLTHDDLEHHDRHLNARNTLVTLLRRGVVPIINENDAVSFTELRFGDNDKLAALTACLLPADLVVILTSAEGLIEGFGGPNPRRIGRVEEIDEKIAAMAGGTTSATAVGGMITKILAARIAVRSGIPLVIAPGRKPRVLERVVTGEDEGTLFVPKPNKLKGRKRWVAFFHHPKGSLIVDEGARRAVRERGKSLLAAGLVECRGDFAKDDVVGVFDAEGTEFARGQAAFSAAEIRAGAAKRAEIVHRDRLVVL